MDALELADGGLCLVADLELERVAVAGTLAPGAYTAQTGWFCLVALDAAGQTLFTPSRGLACVDHVFIFLFFFSVVRFGDGVFLF